MTELLNKTLAQIVTEKHQAATVFEKYHLDFCCKGKRPLSDALVERQLPTEQVVKELETTMLPCFTTFIFRNFVITS
jgi:regulator of cell morphogenesis and NO signaling